MKNYTVTGTVPTPLANPDYPAFDHHHTTMKPRTRHPVGEAGRKVSVTTDSKKVAEDLQHVFNKVFDEVSVTVGIKES